MPLDRPYRGSSIRFVISFDIGTTYSGVSYSILDPGAVPKICTVSRYPGQEYASGSPKIPSIIYYDKNGKMRAAGAETQLDNIAETAEDEGWVRVEWFKLRMRPKSMPVKVQSLSLPPLPANKTIVDVFADMLSYLMSCASKFIEDTHPIASRNWSTLRREATFVIAHPNGWEGIQQAKLRRAAVKAGLVPDTAAGKSRVVFVTEGEASLHFCVKGGYVDNSQKGFVVADLGGGTLDFSAYKVVGVAPLRVEETAPSKCELEGSTFVTQRAQQHLRSKLANSKYGTDEGIAQIAMRFDETLKQTFNRPNDVCFVPFGAALDRDPEYGIRSGKLRMNGEDVARFFEPSVAATVACVKTLLRESSVNVSAIYMVGGFSASPYLAEQLIQRLGSSRMTVSKPDEQAAKAVAHGAVSFYIDHYVSARVAKVTYGVRCGRRFDPRNREHTRRADKIYKTLSGAEMVAGGFAGILEKGTVVSEEKEFREDFFIETEDVSKLGSGYTVFAYIGPGKCPEWIDQVGGDTIRAMFNVSFDFSIMKGSATKERKDGKEFWSLLFEVAIFYGGPEVKAQIVWKENDIERRGPAQIIYEGFYDDDGDGDDDDEGSSYIGAYRARPPW